MNMNMDTNMDMMDESDIVEIVAVLSIEKIHGGCICFLQLDHLRSFGISYGAAVVLIKGMQELMFRHPSKSGVPVGGVPAARMQSQSHSGAGAGAGAGEGIDLDEWLGKKIGVMPPPTSTRTSDRLYNVDDPSILAEVMSAVNEHETGNANPKTNTNTNTNTNVEHQDFGTGGMDMEMGNMDSNELASGRAKEFMNNRFGLELPELRTGQDLPMQDIHTPISPSASSCTMSMPTGSDGDSVGMEDNSNMQLDQALLDSMPASVRDIAKRRPDLVQTLIQSKQQQIESLARSRSNLPSILEDDNQGEFTSRDAVTVNDEGMTRLEPQNCMPGFAEAEDEEYGSWDGTGGYNDERFGLLRRRRNAS